MEHEECPFVFLPLKRGDQSAGDFSPHGIVSLPEFDGMLSQRSGLPHRFDIIEKLTALQNKFNALIEDILCLWKYALERLIREEDAILPIDDEHRLLKAAQSRFQLGELAGSVLLQTLKLLGADIHGIAEISPFHAQIPLPLLQEEPAAFLHRLLQSNQIEPILA